MPNILLFILLIILILVISFIIINCLSINSSSKKIGGSEIVIIPANIGILSQSYGEQNTDVKKINYAERPDGKKLIIGKKSFMNATALTELKVPNFIKRIDNESFMGCTSLASIIFENRPNNSDYNLEIGVGAFKNCISLTELTIPNFIKIISSEAFMGCTSLSSIIFEEDNAIKSYNSLDYRLIMRNAFKNCPSLTNIHNFPPIANFYKNMIFDNTKIDEIIVFTYDNPAIVIRTYLNILNDLISNVLRTKLISKIEMLKAKFLLVEFEKFLSLSNKALYNIIKLHNNIENIIYLIKITIDNISKVNNINIIYKTTLNEILQFFIKQQNLDILNDIIREFEGNSKFYLLNIAPELQKDNIDDKIAFIIDLFKEIYTNCEKFYYGVLLNRSIIDLLNDIGNTLNNIKKLKNVNRTNELYDIVEKIIKFCIDQQKIDENDPEGAVIRQNAEIQRVAELEEEMQQEERQQAENQEGEIQEGEKQEEEKQEGEIQMEEIQRLQDEQKQEIQKQQRQAEQKQQRQEAEQKQQRQDEAEQKQQRQDEAEQKQQWRQEQVKAERQEAEQKQQWRQEQVKAEQKQQWRQEQVKAEQKQQWRQEQVKAERQEAEQKQQWRQEQVKAEQKQQEQAEQKQQQQAKAEQMQQRKREVIEQRKREAKAEQKQEQVSMYKSSIDQQTSIKQQIQEILKQKEEKWTEKKNIYNDDSDYGIDMSPSSQIQKFIKEHTITKIKLINPHNIPDEEMELDKFEMKFKGNTYIPRCEIYASNGDIYKND